MTDFQSNPHEQSIQDPSLGDILRRTKGLTSEQVAKLRTEHSIYAIDSGRICIAALNSKNVKVVAEAIAKVLV